MSFFLGIFLAVHERKQCESDKVLCWLGSLAFLPGVLLQSLGVQLFRDSAPWWRVDKVIHPVLEKLQNDAKFKGLVLS